MNQYTSCILSQIHFPEDLKCLTIEELTELSADIRARIIEVISDVGGHLASNLGSVEIMVALHKVFLSPKDKFIFDVSHQIYAHKLLTNRNCQFETIRQHNGLCGFSYPPESEYDHFHAGHAGTAMSLGLGVAHQRDLSGENYYVIPVLGDASLTCGLTLEALNNLPQDLTKFIVILNDNAMSISKNVGAITRILSRIINSTTSTQIYEGIEKWILKLPGVGRFLARKSKKLTESIKNLVSPAVFFEQYGLHYIGPIDGHNMSELIYNLHGAKKLEKPVLIHVLTNKGQGMQEAIKNPTTYHGVKPFDPETGKFIRASKEITFPKALGKYVVEIGMIDPLLTVVTPAMLQGSCLDEFNEKFPNRCFDVGIAESHAVTFCGGLAKSEKNHVLCVIYSTFLQRAFDNLFHDVCLQESPVVFAIDRAGLSAGDGSTHHGIYDLGFLKAMPNMVVCQPRNATVLKELLNSAFEWKTPAAIRYPNMVTFEEKETKKKRAIGKAELLSLGEKMLIIGLGHMLNTAFEVKKILEVDNIFPTILDPIFIKPLDEDFLHELVKTHTLIVIIEEHSVTTGLGNSIVQFLSNNHYHDIRSICFGIPDRFIPHGSYQNLMDELGLSPQKIADKLKLFMEVVV